MRPRHKAAENHPHPAIAPAVDLASMRPRHKAAENVGLQDPLRRGGLLASMRPRHKAAENRDRATLKKMIEESLQ